MANTSIPIILEAVLSGWIKLHRKSSDSKVFSLGPNVWYLASYFMLNACYKPTSFNGIKLKPGQMGFSQRELAERIGITHQTLRTAIKWLISTHFLTQETTNKYTVITLAKWELYQSKDDELTQGLTHDLTHDQHTANTRLTHQLKIDQKNHDVTSPKKERKKEGKKNTTVEKKFIFDYEVNNFIGMTDQIIAGWKESYPDLDIEREIKRAGAWLSANPKKNDFERFLVNWFNRADQHRPKKEPEQEFVNPYRKF